MWTRRGQKFRMNSGASIAASSPVENRAKNFWTASRRFTRKRVRPARPNDMTTEVRGQERGEIHLDRDHPWPGLISFTEADHSFFFGREREVAELARMIRQETATVFFGKSGLGKSSILRAGVSPLLRDSEFVAIYIRLNHADGSPPLEHQVQARLEETF